MESYKRLAAMRFVKGNCKEMLEIIIVPIARHCMGTVKPYSFVFFKCHFWMLHASGMYTKGVI